MRLIILSLVVSAVAGYVYDTKWYTVPLDHLNFGTNKTFKLRYLINDTYWDKSNDGPIFFYTGNEGDIEMFAENTGFMWEIAPKFKALLVFAEHRYYGKSLPFGNNTYSDLKNMGYLSSSQALADYADLLMHLQQNRTEEVGTSSKRSGARYPVIAFGGSYGGMLAAWFRMKYPYVVDGAIAASAPVLQFTGMVPCEAFSRIVSSDFKAASHNCSDRIKASWSAIDRVSATADGLKWLSSNWSLCSPLKNAENVSALKDWMVGMITNVAMLDYPYPTNFILPLPGYPVQEMCRKILTKEAQNSSLDQDKALLMSIFSGFQVAFNYSGNSSCLNVKVQSSDQLGDDGWDYQSCTEMVMPMCSDGNGDMFEPKKWDIKKETARCKATWGVEPQPHLAELLYGGYRGVSAASNIIFSNGLLDPWSSGGVLQAPKGSRVISITIPEGAHHLDLRGSNPMDPMTVIETRRLYGKVIQKWIRNVRPDSF
ncbi:lysosomal Pro-X carboxypeptidase [Ischnura elegans]|uniref:lysosomal Pro-X carboxypeptidase n=1 Tax=Ischnura elegans TaxID=197161 RepID=UPI001ED87E88|nr:lysosomal Pro-X carboxypeptidase [Ischnura elegans]